MDVAFGYEDGEELGLDPSDAEPSRRWVVSAR
jgi:hypothetical protein